MKKLLLLATVLCIAFALCLSASAESVLPENWEILEDSGIAPEKVTVNEYGCLELSESVTGAQWGIVYTKDLPDSYTLSVDFFIPDGMGGAEPVVAIGASSYSWPGKAAFVYRLHNWGNAYGYVYGHYGVGDSAFISGTEATVPEVVVNGWNNITIQVDGGFANIFFNNNLKMAGLDLLAKGEEGVGEYIYIGLERDEPAIVPTKNPMFKNIKITTAAGTETYFEVEGTPGVDPVLPSTPDASTPDEPEGDVPSIEIKDDGEVAEFDWTIVAIIGGVVVVAAAAVVVFMVLKKKKDA